MKKKKSKKKKGYCYIHMKDVELWLYSPEFYETIEDASKQLMLDCYDIAEHNGYTKDQIFMPGVGEILNKITLIWDNYDKLMEEAKRDYGEDQQGRTEADNQQSSGPAAD